MKTATSFLCQSLREHPRGEAVGRILVAAIAAVEPGEAVRRAARREGETLFAGGQAYELGSFRRVRLLAIGKAAEPMAAEMANLLGERLDEGLVITKHTGPGLPGGRLTTLEGGHPLPDERSLRAGEAALGLLAGLGPEDLLLCLVSGGGSALACAPRPGLGLAEMRALTERLLASGAGIGEINRLRRRLDLLKGGGVARLANGARVLTLILSDVVGNALEAIASGPTAPDPGGRAEALATWKRWGLQAGLPEAIHKALLQASETPKPGDPLFARVQNVLAGTSLLAAQAALRQAKEEGFHPHLLRLDLQGEARERGVELATLLRQAAQTGDPAPAPACILLGGETTVTLQGQGRGGRNTELALAAVPGLAGFPGVLLATMATDGEDGPTDAAGAVVSGETFARAMKQRLNPAAYLARNDSYAFFEALGDLLKPGPTGTNVNDLALLFTW